MGDFQSDQGEVWNQVAMLHDRHGVSAPRLAPCARSTSSARDGSAFSQATFKAQPGQSGLLALWDGKVVGFDVLATPAVYVRLHERLRALLQHRRSRRVGKHRRR